MSDNHLASWIDGFSGRRIGVVGDLMLDRYIWGRASRISQEAPVPVVHVQRESASLGGAANVARNIASLGAEAATFGLIGDDRYGRTLTALLEDHGVDAGGVVTSQARCTTVKTRVIAGTQQVVRIDREESSELDRETQQPLRELILQALRGGDLDAVILEDYAKGVLTRDFVESVLAACAQHDVPVALDPHAANAFNLEGLTLMTPNRAEAFALCGAYYRPGLLPLEDDQALLDVGRQLREKWNPELLLITLGGHGMALFEGDDSPYHIPTEAREVFDVSGAGDTVMATFMVALLAGATPREAARLANHAAGIVVGEVGTAAVTADELRNKIAHESTAR